MTDRRLDERFAIEGDPEDALRGFLASETAAAAEPLWRVVLAEREDGGTFPDDAPDVPGDGFRVFEWRGTAPSTMDAKRAAQVAWAEHYGEPPSEQHRADIYPCR